MQEGEIEVDSVVRFHYVRPRAKQKAKRKPGATA
jgi:hypothetical protein